MINSEIELRPLDENLLSTVHTWFNDPVAFGDFDQPHPITWDELQKKWNDAGYSNVRIVSQSNEPIGWVRFLITEKRPWICGMSIFITAPNKRGQGLGAKALQALMDEVSLSHKDVCKFEVMTDVNNKPAQAMFEKLGFTKEGLFKRYWMLKGKFSDMYSYAILK